MDVLRDPYRRRVDEEEEVPYRRVDVGAGVGGSLFYRRGWWEGALFVHGRPLRESIKKEKTGESSL